MGGIILGIESTAHTFSFGRVSIDGELFPSFSSLFRPEEGGIHPREAADHHSETTSQLLDSLSSSENFTWIQLLQSPLVRAQVWAHACVWGHQ